MSDVDTGQKTANAWALWRRNGVIWLALLGFLILTFGLAYVPLGSLNAVVSLLIAIAKAGLVAVLYMELKGSNALVRLAVVLGLLLLLVMFSLTGADVVTRIWNGWRQ